MTGASPASRHYWILWDSLKVVNGVLIKMFRKRDGTAEYVQIIVPERFKREILKHMHNSLLSGHMGCKKTKAKILQRYYWYNLKLDVKIWVRKCDICAADKRPPKKPKAPLGSIKTGAPWDVLATDYVGSLPQNPQGQPIHFSYD
jgi:hypothetical protein